jgi:hypothetical protein
MGFKSVFKGLIILNSRKTYTERTYIIKDLGENKDTNGKCRYKELIYYKLSDSLQYLPTESI